MQKASIPCTQILPVTQLEQIVAFDERTQSSGTFVQRYLDLVTATSRLTHHRRFIEQMLDLLEEQMLMHLNYRYWAQQTISEDAPGLMLKEDVDTTSRTAILQDVFLLFSDLSEQEHTHDAAVGFLLLRTAILFGKELSIPLYNRRQRSVPVVEARISGRWLIREEPPQEHKQISEEVRYACLFDVVSEASIKYPTSPWPRCLLAMLSLPGALVRTEASLGFLDAFLLLRELESRDQRVRLLLTIIRYCDL